MDKELNSAIIGCGAIHKNHSAAIAQLPGSKLVAVCDNDPAALAKAKEAYGCPAYADFNEMLRQPGIDVVHICTPHYLHAPMAIAALDRGINVLTEKPVAINTAAAAGMLDAAARSGKHLGVCFQNRYNTTSIKLKEHLDSGRAGKVLGIRARVTWSRSPKYYTGSGWRGKWATEGGGVLINQSIHTIDLMQWLLGPVARLKAHTDRYTLAEYIEVEDTAEAFFEFESGARGLFYATNSWIANSPVEIEIVCEKAVMTLNDKLTVQYEGQPAEIWDDSVDRTDEKAYWGNGHMKLIADFYDCIRNGRKFAVSGAEGIPALSIIEAIYKSEASGKFEAI